MKKIALVYSSKHGQTEKIARYMEAKLQERGYSTQLLEASGNFSLNSCVDAVICGSPVYAGKFRQPLLRWVQNHRKEMHDFPVGLFTVTLNAADKHQTARADDSRLLRELISQTGLHPSHVASFAGALKYRSYWWPTRWMMRRIAAKAGGDTDTSRDHEYTSWAQVDSFLSAFVSQKRASPFSTSQQAGESEAGLYAVPGPSLEQENQATLPA